MATLSLKRRDTSPKTSGHDLVAGKRRRKIREALTGYLFVLPAAVVTFLFGLWPVVAGFYESLKSGSPITNKYVGLANYTRSLGSLIYVLLFALCAIFVLLAYRAWRNAFAHSQQFGGALWPYVVPGLLMGAALIALSFVLVTGVEGYAWFPLLLILAAVGGYYLADQLQADRETGAARRVAGVWAELAGLAAIWLAGPDVNRQLGLGVAGWLVLGALFATLLYLVLPRLAQIRSGNYVGASLIMGLLTLLAVLLALYTVDQMEESTAQAHKLATVIFNQRVLEGVVDVPDDTVRLRGLAFEAGAVMVEVKVKGKTIQAPLAPQAYSELPVEKIARLEAAFANNQKVQVILPDGTLAEGQLTGIPQGERLSVPFVTEGARAVRQVDIYSALDVGEAVVRNGGHTEPLRKQVYAATGVFVGLAAVLTMTVVRRKVDDDEHPRLHRWLHLGRVMVSICVFFMFVYLLGAAQLNQQAAAGMGALSQEQFARAYEYATGTPAPATLRPEILKAQLLYWPQVFSIAVGTVLVGAAYLVWQSAQRRETPLGFGLTILLAVAMMVGGWLLISEVPRTLKLGGRETQEAMDALSRTAMYSLGTVPVQLALGLFLAYLLFSEVKLGKSLYRVIYFMPYIAPSVATSAVFLVIFRMDASSLANRALGLFGIGPLTWLKEPQGIFRIFYEQVLGGNPLSIPDSLAGPSLALTSVILYNIWVFSGYNAVVFLAGLGAIPRELYEAAEVDGAGRWSRFRNITLPLLSPTTFFLSMLSVIGTFKAFAHIYVLRGQATGKEIDTMTVHIFQVLYAANDPGYAAALAFSLFGVILVLTMVQNRLTREQVFYG
ncbi:MAG: ABC transporter permease subunit [Aggregatilineaceae bacterium]